jgi:hypothetical protein
MKVTLDCVTVICLLPAALMALPLRPLSRRAGRGGAQCVRRMHVWLRQWKSLPSERPHIRAHNLRVIVFGTILSAIRRRSQQCAPTQWGVHMNAAESKALKKGSRVYWRGNAGDSGHITERVGTPLQLLGITVTWRPYIMAICATFIERARVGRINLSG